MSGTLIHQTSYKKFNNILTQLGKEWNFYYFPGVALGVNPALT